MLAVISKFFSFFSSNDLMQVMLRIFPFGRGLYEDKVANLWCTLSPLFKFKEIYPIQSLLKLRYEKDFRVEYFRSAVNEIKLN